MFTQNPYGRDANVSSALFGLSHSLRQIFSQELAQRQAERDHGAAMQQKAIELKQLDLEGQKQRLNNQLSLRKLDLAAAENQEGAARWERSHNLDNRRVTADIQNRRDLLSLRQHQDRRADATHEFNMDAARRAGQQAPMFSYFGIAEQDVPRMSAALGLSPVMLQQPATRDQAMTVFGSIQKNPRAVTTHATYLLRQQLDVLQKKFQETSNVLLKQDLQHKADQVLDMVEQYQKNAQDPKMRANMKKIMIQADMQYQNVSPKEAAQRAEEALKVADAGAPPAFIAEYRKRFGLSHSGRSSKPKPSGEPRPGVSLTRQEQKTIEALLDRLGGKVTPRQVRDMMLDVGVAKTIGALENKLRLKNP